MRRPLFHSLSPAGERAGVRGQPPDAAEALRGGRLCLSTVAVLEQLLTETNVGELVARVAFIRSGAARGMETGRGSLPHD